MSRKNQTAERKTKASAMPLFKAKEVEIPVEHCNFYPIYIGVVDGWAFVATDILAIAARCNYHGSNISFRIEKHLKGRVTFIPQSGEFYHKKSLLTGERCRTSSLIAGTLSRYLFNVGGLMYSGSETYAETEEWLAEEIGAVPCFCGRNVIRSMIPSGKYGVTTTLSKTRDNLVLIAYSHDGKRAILLPLIEINGDFGGYISITYAIDVLSTTNNLYLGYNYRGNMFICKKDACVIIESLQSDRKETALYTPMNCECGIAVNSHRDRVKCLENDWSEKIDGKLIAMEEKGRINANLVKYLRGQAVQGLIEEKKNRKGIKLVRLNRSMR